MKISNEALLPFLIIKKHNFVSSIEYKNDQRKKYLGCFGNGDGS